MSRASSSSYHRPSHMLCILSAASGLPASIAWIKSSPCIATMICTTTLASMIQHASELSTSPLHSWKDTMVSLDRTCAIATGIAICAFHATRNGFQLFSHSRLILLSFLTLAICDAGFCGSPGETSYDLMHSLWHVSIWVCVGYAANSYQVETV